MKEGPESWAWWDSTDREHSGFIIFPSSTHLFPVGRISLEISKTETKEMFKNHKDN